MSKRSSIPTMILGAAVLLLVSGLGAYAQLQSGGQQACLNAVNKNGAAVFKTQGKEHLGCLKGAGKGALTGTAQACLTADTGGKVAKAKTKTTAAATKSCGTAPNFGFTGATTVNASAQQADVDLVADIYGANLDAAVINCSASKAGCTCQQKVSKDLEGLAAAKLATFVACKKAVLKAGATSSSALADCVNNGAMTGSITNDSKGKISKVFGKLIDDIIKACDTPNVTAGAFPGNCNGVGIGGALALCLDRQVECRVCQAINEIDGLFVNCDLFDNGVADATCLSGTGPTPTPTATLTPTPTPTATFQPGTIFQGAIARTIGHWTYNAVNGLAGGDPECNDKYPGSHVCTASELLSAEALGELALAVDTNGLAIDHFWAVDPARPDLNQCISAPPGAIIRWAYATGHTSARGDFFQLNNATGDLGALNNGAGTGVVCTGVNLFSVGCCL